MAQVGIFDRPTLVNNVETLFWVRDIVEKGADWFASQGKGESKGLAVIVPTRERARCQTRARRRDDSRVDRKHCGGMADGRSFKGYLPGGASGGILPASMAICRSTVTWKNMAASSVPMLWSSYLIKIIWAVSPATLCASSRTTAASARRAGLAPRNPSN